MTEAEKLKHCRGCRDNFYNGNNPMGVQRCWMLKTAKMVKRYRIGTWTVPTEPGAFTEVKGLSCFHRDGEHYNEKLPELREALGTRAMTQDDLRLDMVVTATVNGIRSRFRIVERMNLGPGWMCKELDGKLPGGIYASQRMTDIAEQDNEPD